MISNPPPPTESSLTYDFFAPQRIVFGWGRRQEIGALAVGLGRRAFVVTGSRTLEKDGKVDELLQLLEDAGVEALHLAGVSHEPEVKDVDEFSASLARQCLGEGDFVIGLGGGSAIDLAKAVPAMATNRESSMVTDYLEDVGRQLKLKNPPLAIMAV